MKFARKALTKSAVLYQSFFSETGLENPREIGRFFHECVPENPGNLTFFPATYQKPCLMSEICLTKTLEQALDFVLCSPQDLLLTSFTLFSVNIFC